jgi:hypothetical protein
LALLVVQGQGLIMAELLAGVILHLDEQDRAAFAAMLQPGYEPKHVDPELRRLITLELRRLKPRAYNRAG